MEEWLLTDETISRTKDKSLECYIASLPKDSLFDSNKAVKLQGRAIAKAEAKKLAEWLEEKSLNLSGNLTMNSCKEIICRIPLDDWQALQKAVEDK